MNQAINHRQYVILISSKNINILHMPIFGHTILATFAPIAMKIFMWTQETIIY